MTDERGRVGGKEIHEQLQGKKDLEDKINHAFAACFSTSAGEKVLTYLTNIYWNKVHAAAIPVEQANYEAGAKYVIGEIKLRIQRGKHENV